MSYQVEQKPARGTLDRKKAIAFFDFRQNMFCAIAVFIPLKLDDVLKLS
ncbi:MAG: hypothetical protein V7L21_30730 [Nostoc sp.]|nr:hypothetical protein [Nostoc sp. NMS9]MBN3944558.1 hypothetical protein [Nostoc sp. NMS9]